MVYYFLLFTSFFWNIEIDADKEFFENLIAVEKETEQIILQKDYFQEIKQENYVLSGKDLRALNNSFFLRNKLLTNAYSYAKEIEKEDPEKSLILRNAIFECVIWQQKILVEDLDLYFLINEENPNYSEKPRQNLEMANLVISHRFRKKSLALWKKLPSKNPYLLNQLYTQKYLIDNQAQKESIVAFDLYIDSTTRLNGLLYAKIGADLTLLEISRRFSNYVGEFSIRKGKLYKKEEFLETVTTNLEPLDVLLEKTPFRLTDKLIPGYWGHAAIHIGNEMQLKELGLWDDPVIKPYQSQIKSGATIIEALRDNVSINSFEEFSNIDDFALIRLKESPSQTEKKQMILTAFKQLGKAYDFGFDVQSSERIVCSELHYLVYEQIPFDTSKIVGRYTISVDQVALQGTRDNYFKVILLYLNGKEIPEDKNQSTFDELILKK